jgi:CRISPR-associated protein Cas1
MAADLHLLPKFRDRLSYLYIEHAMVEREQNSIAFYAKDGDDVTMTQVPVCNIALLMLGPGTKVTHGAMDILSRNNCLVAWTGEEGVRLYAFGTGGTHSSERLLRQAKLVSDPELRIQTCRQLYSLRFLEALDPEVTIEQLRGKEGYRVRRLYKEHADQHGIEWEGRSYDRNKWQGSDLANRALSAANACLYGVCHAAVLGMGFSPALGFIHTGKQLSFIYDVADLYKMELAVPVAFREAALGSDDLDRRVRTALRDVFREYGFMAKVANDLMKIFGSDESDNEQFDTDPALPGQLIGGAEGGVSHGLTEEEN